MDNTNASFRNADSYGDLQRNQNGGSLLIRAGKKYCAAFFLTWALRELISAAASEVTCADWNRTAGKELVDVLMTTDALYVLDRLVTEAYTEEEDEPCEST